MKRRLQPHFFIVLCVHLICTSAICMQDVPTLMSATWLHCQMFLHWWVQHGCIVRGSNTERTWMQHRCNARHSYTDALHDVPSLICATHTMQDIPTLMCATDALQDVPTLKGHKLNTAVLQNVPTLKTHECTTLKEHQLPFQRHAKANCKTWNLGRQVYRLTHNPICLKKHLLGHC